MKKNGAILIACFLLLLPIYADATLLDSGTLMLNYSGPALRVYLPHFGNMSGVYSDYEGNYEYAGTNYAGEFFCVEEVYAMTGLQAVSFYSIDGNEADYLKLAKAAWIADWFTSASDDRAKAAAQLAIWEVMFENPAAGFDLTNGDFSAADSPYLTYALNQNFGDAISGLAPGVLADHAGSWMVARNPDISHPDNPNYQDFLVPRPVPEPATVLLLAAGLIGLATVRRKKFGSR